MNIENEIEKAFRRKAPPPGFSARVMDRIHHESASKKRFASGSLRGWVIAASVILAILVGALARREIVESRLRAEGEWAKQQVILAMQIASNKTNLARDNVRKSAEPARQSDEAAVREVNQ